MLMIKTLIVDDNEKIAKSTAMAFEVLGCETAISMDSLKAPSIAEDFCPDIIVLDIGMPGKNGYELCRDLRQNGFQNTLIIAHTGWGSKNDRERAREAGFDDVLTKPVKLDEFQRQIDTLQDNPVK